MPMAAPQIQSPSQSGNSIATLRELFKGSRELFEGPHAYDHCDWSERYPVVKLSFGKGDSREPGYLHTNLPARLGVIERAPGVEPLHGAGPEPLDHLLRTLHHQTGQQPPHRLPWCRHFLIPSSHQSPYGGLD